MPRFEYRNCVARCSVRLIIQRIRASNGAPKQEMVSAFLILSGDAAYLPIILQMAARCVAGRNPCTIDVRFSRQALDVSGFKWANRSRINNFRTWL